MNYLLDLARGRGQTWTYAQNLLRDLGLDPQELRQALLYLQGRGLVYIWFDRKTGAARIGLRLNC